MDHRLPERTTATREDAATRRPMAAARADTIGVLQRCRRAVCSSSLFRIEEPWTAPFSGFSSCIYCTETCEVDGFREFERTGVAAS
jgi:hypothetical protein